MENTIVELKFSLDTFYFLISGILVMWMAAGFAMLEAGLVRSKNTTEILTKNVALYSIACTMFLLVGYNIMYVDNGEGGIIPSIGALIGTEAADADHSLESDFFFQVVFVATAMSIVSGAVAERMKLFAFLAFAVVLTGFIYPMEGYWTWGGGFLSEMGFVDFAGSAIVHGAGAAAALAGVILLGARKGKYGKNGEIYPIPGSNLPLATLGTFILWMGWFGFNGGSQLLLSDKENATAVGQILLNTNAAAAMGAIAALFVCKVLWGKADLTMVLNGALAGLVVITADPLSPSPLMACLLGILGGSLVVFSIVALDKAKIDDPVGAISVHGVCGALGIMLVPVSNGDANFVTQLIGLVTILAFVFVASFIVWAILKQTMGIRVTEEEELSGMDQHDCGVDAYPEFVSVRSN
ncbi:MULTISPECIES: ammonium transporter [Pseudoalteromonas]|uniref:Ammonium transporter AmtB-like domain-containing protein n=2 Tax=Pseudoalteromonas carrageenovora IAM 12662 TaxID=1314868 RepID=A0A2K4X788_PSEVC|nr:MULTISPECIES: ammonium transporter [Pseudoalteromonas]KTF17486.1 ammonium transporter [Pseudoalteromonas sp. H103]MCQ8890227.1 ammonium transporter [Pseudoalteromonas carrageenovora]MDO6466197.1 ammonium transporter [Pseudoalteromonas carrageenovora]MDO6549324.1 ammonium transporter [Pseudoalteromonas carrageenovora]MDO6634787.1 ammonium transporter [Pseudoalteromonas carrageenovora]|tara:strand:+ start:296 stop:1525 length:1230 start_codon:yes stop_codon:yes gene_type:complete